MTGSVDLGDDVDATLERGGLTIPKKNKWGVAHLVSINNNVRDLGWGVDLVGRVGSLGRN